MSIERAIDTRAVKERGAGVTLQPAVTTRPPLPLDLVPGGCEAADEGGGPLRLHEAQTNAASLTSCLT